MTDINECSICLELLDNKYPIYVLECSHQYHITCLTNWYKNPISNYKCPLCNEISDIINVTNFFKTISPTNLINNINSNENTRSTNISNNSNNRKQNCIIL